MLKIICSHCGLTNGDHSASCQETASDPRAFESRQYWGVLWMDDHDDSVNFKFHIAGGDFLSAREVLIKFRDVIQARLDAEKRCPYFETAAT
jgi:hypothetical protein